MQKATFNTLEKHRFQELYNYEALGNSLDEEFNEIVQLASQICNVPVSLISLVDAGRQWLRVKDGYNFNNHFKESSFSSLTLSQEEDIFEIDDASKDFRFFDNPLVTDTPNIRFYAGVPLVSKHGYKLGTLCVINSVAQHLTDDQSFGLKVLGNQVIKLLELRLNNKELTIQKTKLKQQAEMQNRIISIIAHDIRSPIASLKQIVEFNNNNILSEKEAKELMEMAETHLDGTLSLLSDLLEWGRMQITAHVAEKKPIHLHKLIEDKFSKLFAATLVKENKLINLVDRDLVINEDPNAIKFILRNLLSNANKFTEKGTITVYAHREKDKVLISVSDTGVGMEDTMKKQVLENKGKLSALGTQKEKGSGLGLMFTKDFIDLLGATISIKSNKGKGTTFYIELKG